MMIGGGCSPSTETLTSDIQPVVTCKLSERRHVVGVVGQVVGLLRDALGSLLDALIVCVLRRATIIAPRSGDSFV